MSIVYIFVDSINFIPQKTLANFSANDTLKIAKALGSSGQKLDKEKAQQLGKKVPKDADAGDMLSLASSIPLDCFKNTSVDKLVANFSNMDIENMDKSRKAFIAKKVNHICSIFLSIVINYSISLLFVRSWIQAVRHRLKNS